MWCCMCALDKSFYWVQGTTQTGNGHGSLTPTNSLIFEVTGPRHGQPRPLSTPVDTITIVATRFLMPAPALKSDGGQSIAGQEQSLRDGTTFELAALAGSIEKQARAYTHIQYMSS